MAASVAPLTVEQFLALPEELTLRKELIDGEMVDMGSANWDHEIVKGLITARLGAYALQNSHLFCAPESMFRVAPGNALIPDVAMVAMEDAKRASNAKTHPIAPILAVEIVSSEQSRRAMKKVKRYLEAGARAVWLVYPEEEWIEVIYPDFTARYIRKHETIEEPALLPGFSLRLAELFS